MKRRDFLAGTATAASLSAFSLALPQSVLAMQEKGDASKYLDSIGLQLWTVRNQMSEDQTKTLAAVKEAGYKQVELMNVLDSVNIVKEAREIGLKVTSAFVNWQSVLKLGNDGLPSCEDIVAKAKELDIKHLVYGYIGKGHRETVDLVKKVASTGNEFGKMCSDAGMQLCYHNHSFEFEKIDGETTGFDVLMNEFDDRCKFELDVFWAKIGGWDPYETLKKLNGRLTQVHLKDLKEGSDVVYDEGKVPTDAFQECGDGTIDMAKVMKIAEECGATQCHVEQDQSPDPIASIGQSIKHLNGLTS
jgi:sugar phosphate isomerase/epimerase